MAKMTKPASGPASTAERQQPARKGKAGAQPQPRVMTIPCPDTEDAGEANRILAKEVPGWDSLSPVERDELAKLIRAYRGAPAVKVKMTRKPDGGWSIEPAGKSEMLGLLKLHKAFASNSMDPVNARAQELLRYLGSVGADNESRYNAALSFIESMNPQNQAEALLLVQMYVTHDAAIRSLSMMGSAEWVPQAQTYGNLAAKLLRTSHAQMETLARLRRGGEQVVRHVHVDNRGGQAVLAENVHTGGEKNGKIEDQSHGAGAAGIGPALLGTHALGNGVSLPGCTGPEAVPYARGDKSGSA